MVQDDPVQRLTLDNARLQQQLALRELDVVRLQQEVDRLLREVAQLQTALERATRKLATLRRESDERQKELLAQIASLAEEVAKGNERIAELLAIAQRKKRKPKVQTETPPELPPELDEATRTAFEDRPSPPEIPPKPEKVPKVSKPTGRKRLPDHLLAEEHVVYPDVCTCGCTDFEIIDEVVEEKLTVVKEHQRKRVVHRKTGRCKRCLKKTTARSLPAPFPRSKATCDWLAWLVVQKFVQLLPLDRIRDLLHRQRVPLAISYLVTQVQRVAGLLAAIDGVHWQQLLAGDWLATDATSLKVIVEGVPGTHSGHLEVFQREGLVVFQYEPEKGAATLASKLSGFEGTLLADQEHRHNAVFADGTVVEAGCNAHGERKLEAAEKSRPVLAKEGRDFITMIYIEEARAREQELTGEALLAWRQDRIAPLFETFRVWKDAVLPALVPDEPLAKTLRYYTNHWDALTRFVSDANLPVDNSASEREFQRVAKLRQSCLFAGGPEGAHAMAILMGLAATCRHLGVDPQAYFTWALERRGTHRDVFGLSAEQLTPAAFAATLDA